MLRRKNGHSLASAQASQRATSPGMLSSSRKGMRYSHLFQAVPNSLGYLEPLEDSTWSQNVDSAASMYPPPSLPLTLDLGVWGEDYQDLSSWCSRPQQDIVEDTKGSSCIVQDDELNTPDVGVQHGFNFTASSNVLKENTLQYLSDGWDTSPPLYVPQKSSIEPVKGTDTYNTRSVTGNEFFTDDGCVLSVSHEEEIVTSRNVEGLNLEDSVQTKESNRLKQSVNLYELGVAHVVKSMNVANDKSIGQDGIVVIKADTDRITDTKMEIRNHSNTDKVTSLQSLLGSDFCVGTGGNDDTVEESLSLKNLLSGSSYTHSNAEIKILDETSGSDTVMSKVTDTVLPKKCEIFRPVSSNACMLQTPGPDEDAGKFSSVVHVNAAKFAGQKEMTPSMFRMELSVKLEQQSGPVGSEPPETATHLEILEDMNLEPQVAGGGSARLQPQAAMQEENTTRRNLELNVSTAWEGTDESNLNISTPDVMEFLLKQHGNFDLVAYLFSNPKEIQQDLLAVSGDDRISSCCTGDTAKVAQIERSSDAELFDSSQDDDDDVKVEVVKPFCISESDEEWKDSVLEPMELEAEEGNCSLKHRSPQLLEGQAKTNVKKALRGSKRQQMQKGTEATHDIQPGNTLESTILQDGSDLRIKISKVKASAWQTNSTKVALPQEQVNAKVNVSELNELSLPKQTRGRPTKRALPSAYEKNERDSATRPPQRKSKHVDEPWIPPSKRRLTSDEPCDRYRELRDKNNEASRKSRQNRKARESEAKEYAAKLESENQTLKIKAEEMERLVKKLREALLEAVVRTKK